MKATDLKLNEMLEFKPEDGLLQIGSKRMLIINQDSMLALRKLLEEQVGLEMMVSILSKFGYECGKNDYEELVKLHEWDEDMDKIAAGPVMHSWEGIVHARPTFLEFDRKTGHFHMKGIWRNSYEAEIHKNLFGVSEVPFCFTLSGYASGYCTAFFGRPCLAIETMCACCGDEHCEFEIKPVEVWDEQASVWRKALESSRVSLTKELEDKLATIMAQQKLIAELSTPILEIWDGIICVPVIGTIDTARSSEMTDKLLQTIVDNKTRGVIIDITGIDVMDTKTADHFIKMAKSIKLLGSKAVITGISPAIAQTLTHIGVELAEIETLRNLEEGLKSLINSTKGK